ncbi:MAG: M20 family metallopeptidase [Candidatus Acetothermia bacterium]
MEIELTPEDVEKTVKLTRDMVRVNTENPPGNEDELAGPVEDYLQDLGIETERVELEEGRSSVLGTIPGKSEGSVVLCGHLDTVRADESSWDKPPFDGVIEGGRLHGRGSADMKGGVAAIMQLARLVVESHATPERTIKLALTADEEHGYTGAKSLVDKGKLSDAEFLIVTEPTDGNVYIGQRGELWVKAKFHGKAAHGSIPETGLNSILPGARFALKIQKRKEELFTDASLGATSLNIGRFDGGWQVNVVPEETTLKLDYRVISHDHKEEILGQVEETGGELAEESGTTFTFSTMTYKSPIISDSTDYYVEKFFNVAKEYTAEEKIGGIAPYSTDATAIVPELDIPVIIYGPGSIELAHQPNEFLDLDSLEESLRLLRSFVGSAL